MPCRPGRTMAPSTVRGWRSPADPRPESALRRPRRRPPRPWSGRSPGRAAPRRSAIAQSMSVACRSGQAGSARYRLAPCRWRSRRAARSRLARQTPVPARRPRRRKPARRPTIGDPSRPTASRGRSRRIRCPAPANRPGGSPLRERVGRRPARAVRLSPGRGHGLRRCRTWLGGPGDG
ncbi:Uncharacterised protein [Mycobacterium tuberculosis]|nr:Uncharacterised protein [Mycobacterium tuberculosis]CKR82682.1 Uncharacterised protein [Mycobacterium tuberculosis]CKT75049.1 Uncharacterised protein [Mycobacterium tuberculosis]CKU15719.1 Uncharacterised protein [Mycobacterium tuberculosis]